MPGEITGFCCWLRVDLELEDPRISSLKFSFGSVERKLRRAAAVQSNLVDLIILFVERVGLRGRGGEVRRQGNRVVRGALMAIVLLQEQWT